MSCKPRLRLSPNEVENLLKAEKCKWRKFRIQQVRAQSNEEALRIRQAVKSEGEKQKSILKNKIEKQWNDENKKKLNYLEKEYAKGLAEFGDAHRKAKLEKCAEEEHKLKELRNAKVAKDRGRKALQILDRRKLEEAENKTKLKSQKQKITLKETKRAKNVAKLPTPPRLKIKRKSPVKIKKKVMFHEAGTHTTSSYTPSSVEVIKEKTEDKASAKKIAELENEKLKEMEEERKKNELEMEKKVQERARIALRKERTRELYSELMADLEEAENDRHLSEYLRGEELLLEQISKARAKEQSAKEAEAERKARKIFDQVLGDTQVIPIEIGSGMEESSIAGKESETTVNGGDDAEGDKTSPPREDAIEQVLGGRDRVDDSRLQTNSLSDTDNIHLKRTVPAHKLPIVEEKFERRTQRVSSSPSMSSSDYTTTVPDSTKSSETSYEEILVRIKIGDPTHRSTGTQKNVERARSLNGTENVSSSSKETEYMRVPQLTSRSRSTDSKSGDSSSKSTEYFGLPHPKPIQDEDDTISKNLRYIEESRRKIQRLIDELHSKPGSKEAEESCKDFKTFKTPPRIYTEDIKSESSGERPQSRRQKFEQCKRELIRHYLRRLLKMKKDDVRQMSSSSVEGSEISLSRSSHLKDLWNTINECGVEEVSSSNTEVSGDKYTDRYTDIDTVPSKMSSSTESTKSSQRVTSTFLSTPSVPPTSSSAPIASTPIDPDLELKQQIYRRLLQLQRLKQQVILKQQKAIGPSIVDQVDRRPESSERTTASGSDSSYQTLDIRHSIGDEDSSDLTSTLQKYETPSREASTQSWPDFSPPPPPKNATHEPEVSSKETHDRDLIPVNVLPSIRDEIGKSYNSLIASNVDSSYMGSKRVSDDGSTTTGKNSHSVNEPTRVDGEVRVEPSATSSSPSSIPDMGTILQHFGLGWARSMIKKMDDADRYSSSDG